MPRSMLSGYAIQHMRKLQNDLFQTGLKEADPELFVTFTRYNVQTETTIELDPQRVLVRWRHDKKLIRVYGGRVTPLGTSPTELDGMFSAFDPFDVNTGDKFTLQGVRGRIIEVWPVRNGRRRAAFTVEGDLRPHG